MPNDGIEKFAKCLQTCMDAMLRHGISPDVVVVGSAESADLVRRSLDYLHKDAHIVIDSELSKDRWFVVSHEALKEFQGGGKN